MIRALLSSTPPSGMAPRRADAILATHPELASSDIYIAATLGDADAVGRFMAQDRTLATAKGGPRNVDALTYLCFSTYLRQDRGRTADFVRAATALLDAGADADTGFFDPTHHLDAAGVAQHPELTRLLIERGADPNRMSRWHNTPLHQALRRDNALENIAAFLEAGADPPLKSRLENRSSLSIAARRGRKDVLDAFERRGHSIVFAGVERLIGACARNEPDTIAALVTGQPDLIAELRAEGSTLLAEFAGTGNVDGVRHLLDLGVPVDSRYDGDPYYGIPKNSTALHVAAWKAYPMVVSLLIARGSSVNAVDDKAQTPLMLVVRACVDSYWMRRRSPDSTAALLRAGARVDGVPFPSGYREVDELLEPRVKTE
jgi:ankyrin repeat protein